MADIDKLKKDACVVRDAQKELENTAYRIGSLFLSVIESYKAAGAPASKLADGFMSAEQVSQLESCLGFLPIKFDKILSVFSYKAGQSTSEPGKKVFDTKSGLFLWEVTRLDGSVTKVEYYQGKAGDMSVGVKPTLGRIYVCGTRTFIGVAEGLSELFKIEAY